MVRPFATRRGAAALALAGLGAFGLGALAFAGAAHADEDDILVEFHFKPVAGTQIAIWLETPDGQFVQDVFVTQATGSLGIGNRSGRWDFLSSWRFPYGPRPQVLPVWAHARGRTYPKLVFHDSDATDQDSLGWHESTSSPEPYYCRPLAADEHETISTDTMTCPSPSGFQTDKGRFDPGGATSPYPPRGDLTSYEDGHDHADVYELAGLNDLDAVTGATPAGDTAALVTAVIDGAFAEQGPLLARIEVNLEHDENADWDFDRETDHYVDPRLASFGIEYLGQPSVIYEVEFDPAGGGFAGTEQYVGYGDWDGATGTLNPPDATISASGGSGADRLQLYTLNDETFRFGVYAHGPGSGGGEDDTGGPDDPPGWGACKIQSLPGMASIELEALEFDTVRVHFTLPSLASDVDVRNVRIYYRAGEMPLSDANAGSAVQTVPLPEDCGGDLVPGGTGFCDVRGLFGNHTYQVGVRYEDACSNASTITADSVVTPAQQFAQVESFCFVATAAFGAPWEEHVRSLRLFRDAFMKPNVFGAAFVAFYYHYGPTLAAAIDRVPLSRPVVREGLRPMVALAEMVLAASVSR